MLKKITNGFVIQSYDETTKQFVSQEFVAGEAEYETESGYPAMPEEFVNADGNEVYLPFHMVQPPKPRRQSSTPGKHIK